MKIHGRITVAIIVSIFAYCFYVFFVYPNGYVNSKENKWNFVFAVRGYHAGETPGKSGSTRVVWSGSGGYLVLKLFNKNYDCTKEPRTIKFWKTSDLNRDYLRWISSRYEFIPTANEMRTFEITRDEMLSHVQN